MLCNFPTLPFFQLCPFISSEREPRAAPPALIGMGLPAVAREYSGPAHWEKVEDCGFGRRWWDQRPKRKQQLFSSKQVKSLIGSSKDEILQARFRIREVESSSGYQNPAPKKTISHQMLAFFNQRRELYYINLDQWSFASNTWWKGWRGSMELERPKLV